MGFSGLETALFALLGSVFSASVVRIFFVSAFVKKESCEFMFQGIKDKQAISEQNLLLRLEQLEKEHYAFRQKMSEEQNQQYKMLRALILYSSIPKDKQAEILNANR